MSEKEKKTLSSARIITKNSLLETKIIIDEIKNTISKKDNYLFIYFPGEKQSKITIFPIEGRVYKLLIKLRKFSPQLVKGISDIIKELHIDKHLIHTTGLCFSNDECYYETYLNEFDFNSEELETKLKNIDLVLDIKYVEVNKI